MSNQKKTILSVLEMQTEAKRIKRGLEEYLEDLQLFSKPCFWKAVQEKSGKTYQSAEEYVKEKGFE